MIVENLKEGLLISDLEGDIDWASTSAATLSGYAAKELMAMNVFGLVHPEDTHLMRASMQDAAASGRHELAQFRLRHKDGHWIIAASTAARITSPEGELRLLVTARNITQRITAQRALVRRAREQEVLAALSDRALGGVAVDDLLREATTAAAETLDTEYAAYFSFDPVEQMVTFQAGYGVTVDTGNALRLPVTQSIAGNAFLQGRALSVSNVAESEYGGLLGRRLLPANSGLATPVGRHGAIAVYRGDEHEFADSDRLFLQSLAHMLAHALNRAQNEARVTLSERRYRQIVETAEEGIWLVDRDGITSFANRKLAEILGYQSTAALIGRNLRDTVANDAARELIERALAESARGLDGQFENAHLRADGSEVWLQISASPIFDENGFYVGSLGMVTDISERRESEEKLKRLSRQNEMLLRSAGEGILALQQDGRITFINPAAGRILDYRPEEVIAQPLSGLVFPSKDPSSQDESPIVQALLEGKDLRADDQFMRRGDGSFIPVECTVAPLREEDGASIGAVIVFRDISRQQHLVEQYRQAQKLEAVGQLAGGIAHDFNNLLAVISGRADMLISSLTSTDPIRAEIDEIARAADRAAQLTRQLLTFSRRRVVQPTLVDLNDVVHNFERMVQRIIGEHIEIVSALDVELPWIKADAFELEQVLMNLAVNSRDAMPNGGRLLISTSTVTVDGDEVAAYPAVNAGTYVLLAVADDGHGMDEETKQRIFEPFYTTKGTGEGTGLGLATVYGIVEQAGGHIRVESTPGVGTAFNIYLPALSAEQVSLLDVVPDTGSDAIAYGHEHVLVVEDEAMVRLLVEDMLLQAGYSVDVAADGKQAQALFADGEREYDLLLTDIVMPGISGSELAELFRQSQPHASVIFTSGYTDGAISKQGLLSPGVSYLQKPFTVAALTQKIRAVLDQEGARV